MGGNQKFFFGGNQNKLEWYNNIYTITNNKKGWREK